MGSIVSNVSGMARKEKNFCLHSHESANQKKMPVKKLQNLWL